MKTLTVKISDKLDLKLLLKYRSVPISLADACLIRMSELYPDSRIFTLDSDFTLYRKDRRHIIPTIMPG